MNVIEFSGKGGFNMPMTRDEHEALLNELLLPELVHTRRTEILTSLRTDYTSVHTDFETLTTNNTRLQADNADLIVSNSKLFRQAGIVGTEGKQKEEEKQLSETITIEELERG